MPRSKGRLFYAASSGAADLGSRAGEPTAEVTARAAASEGERSPQILHALGAAGIGILIRDAAGRTEAVNERFCELAGQTKETLSSRSVEHLLHPEDTRRFAQLYARHCLPGDSFDTEVRFASAQGEVRWCALHIRFEADDCGRLAAVTIVARDIGVRKQAEQRLLETEEHHRSTAALAAQINWIASPLGLVEEASPRWTQVTGLPPGEALGAGWLSAVHPDDVTHAVADWTEALVAKRPVDVEYRLRTARGGYRWFRSRAAPRVDDAGEVLRWYGTLEDIDDRRRAEQGLRESEERFRLAAQAANLGIWDFDVLTGRREWSDGLKAMLGLPHDGAADLATALALVVAEDQHRLTGLVEAVRSGDSEHRFDTTLRIRRADTGSERWLQTSGWCIQAPGGRLERVLVTIRDVTDERTAAERTRWIASHDALTGLSNRASFTEELEAAIARAQAAGSTLALVLFDIDHLKSTNDTIGHDAGDMLLQTFASRLREHLGSDIFLGRLGGDEFAALFPDESDVDVSARVAATLDRLRDPFTYDGGTIDCQATAGASFFPLNGIHAADLLKAADIALYAGKAGHRGALSIFRPEMRAGMQRRASMLAVARTVARDEWIVPFYQPKVDLGTGRLVGFEALLRWRHETLGIQGPETIAAAFEDLNLAPALGQRMLDQICGDIAVWLDRGLDIGTIAFNLSPAEFRRDDLFDRILERLHRSAIPPSMIELEITETVFLGRGAEAVASTLAAFHREGFRIALDDFGTGYASLTHLQAFPVDIIKIDRSFVANVTGQTGDAAIVEAVIGLARRLDIDVVAEGIETRAQADYLTARGCGYGQGYLFGRPVRAEEAETMITLRDTP